MKFIYRNVAWLSLCFALSGDFFPLEYYNSFDPTAKLGVKDDGYGYPGGSGYVWHCHIADHEDNMMMRPLQVINTPQH